MALEIERKFLVTGEHWRSLGSGTLYRQGYIPTQHPETTVRVRIVGEQGYITIKGKSVGLVRSEFEYAIPLVDAEEMLNFICDRPLIEKIRYKIPQGNLLWEVDDFKGENQGLILAEVELQDPQQEVNLPDWIGQEVTGDFRYYNASLVKSPYQTWHNPI